MICITVCINYADYLAETLKQNRKFFKNYYLVTEESDIQTIALGKEHNCHVLITTRKNEDGAKFNKSGMIHDAQKIAHWTYPYEWICLLDADVLLPDSFKSVNLSSLKKDYIYGIERRNYDTRTDYLEDRVSSVEKIEASNENSIYGYFQLYWIKRMYYQRWSQDCSKCDDIFMKRFIKRVQLTGGIYCSHFGLTCKNWEGRTTELWS
jgi:hypothetical protein